MTGEPTAILFSGGLDSAVLLAHEAQRGHDVWPLHVRAGLAWEDDEARVVDALLHGPPFAGRARPITTLHVDMRDVYPASHWAVRGTPPAFDTPDEDVYLEGRNLILISKAAVQCARLKVSRLVLGPLAGNPFPDATPAFFAAMARAASLGLNHAIRIEAPFADRHKEDVVRLGVELGVPLEITLSCMNPSAARHCGRCSKCRERRDAFIAARIEDRTAYIHPPAR